MRTMLGLGLALLLITTTSAMAWVFTAPAPTAQISADDGDDRANGGDDRANGGDTDDDNADDDNATDDNTADDNAADRAPGDAAPDRPHPRTGGSDSVRPVAEPAPDLRLPGRLPALPTPDPEAAMRGAYGRAALILDRVEATAIRSVERLERLHRSAGLQSPEVQEALKAFAAEVGELAEDFKGLEPLLTATEKEQLEQDGRRRLEPVQRRLQALLDTER